MNIQIWKFFALYRGEIKKTDRLTLNLKSKEFNDYAGKIYK